LVYEAQNVDCLPPLAVEKKYSSIAPAIVRAKACVPANQSGNTCQVKRGQESKRKKIKEEANEICVLGSKRRTARIVPALEILRRLDDGQKLTAIAREYELSHQTLSNALQRLDRKRYKEAMYRRTLRQRVLPGISKLWKRLGSESSVSIAKEYSVSKTALSNVLKEIDGERYKRIMSRRTLRQRILPIVSKIWKRLENGDLITAVAKEYNTFDSTLSEVLQKIDRKRYEDTMRKRALRTLRQRIIPEISDLWKRMQSGESLFAIAREYGVNMVTLRCMLQRIDGRRYEDVMTRRREIQHLAKRSEGADSLFELEVKRTLEQYGVSFEFHPKLQKCQYLPDFKIGEMLIEAAGLSYGNYWMHYR
jgi:lambda repressor-like predicted transcriptional regulator